MSKSNNNAICLENLTRDFDTTRAVDGLSLVVPQGMIYGFLGPNGAGKTTTIRILLGLLDPTAGSATVLGFDTKTQADQIRANTGALLEHTGIYERLSAEDNLEFYGRIYNIPDASRGQRIRELLTQMGLWERRKELAGKWSRGMKQRLALARVMLHRPKLILLDEPTAGLDVISAAEIRKALSMLVKQEGITVFLTTHNMSEAEDLCGQIAVIRKGKLVARGTQEELRTKTKQENLEDVFLSLMEVAYV